MKVLQVPKFFPTIGNIKKKNPKESTLSLKPAGKAPFNIKQGAKKASKIPVNSTSSRTLITAATSSDTLSYSQSASTLSDNFQDVHLCMDPVLKKEVEIAIIDHWDDHVTESRSRRSRGEIEPLYEPTEKEIEQGREALKQYAKELSSYKPERLFDPQNCLWG